MASMSTHPAHAALSFDIFGTVMNCDAGEMEHLRVLAEHLAPDSPMRATPFPAPAPPPGQPLPTKHPLLALKDRHERALMQQEDPIIRYEDTQYKAFLAVADDLHSPLPRDQLEERAKRFATSQGTWPAFGDSVAALNALRRGGAVKLIAITNCSNQGIGAVLQGPLQGVAFDAVYTAEDMGAYKPSRRAFEFLLRGVERDFGIARADLLHVAHGVQSDQVPAEKMDINHVWIERGVNNWGSESQEPMKRLSIAPDLKTLAARTGVAA